MNPDVALRPVVEDDLELMFEHQRDPVSVRMAAFASRERDAFTAHWAKVLLDDTVITRAILVDGEFAGYVAAFGSPEERLVGYWIGREHWGRGLATRGLAALLAEVRERPLFAHVAKHNAGSIRVLEKCGFKVAGEDASVPGPDGTLVEDWIMRLDD